MKWFKKRDKVLVAVGGGMATRTHKKAVVEWMCGRAYATVDDECGELLPGGKVSGAPWFWEKWKPADDRMLEFFYDTGKDSIGNHVVELISGYLDDMLDNAQVLRVQQLQAATESVWPERLTEKADAAWKTLNAAHKEAYELLKGISNE